MADNANSIRLLQRLIAELKGDKKRTCILGVLLAIGLVIGGKALMSNLPAKAAAAPAKKAAAKQEPVATRQGDSAKRLEARNAYIKGLNGQISRDVFSINPVCFTEIAKAQPQVVVPTTATAPADRGHAIIEAQAQTLKLQTIMYGSKSMVSIDGQILRVGDTVKGFKIVEIRPDSCLLLKDDVTVERKLESEARK